MRTTIDLDDDTAAAIAQLRAHEGLGLSKAVNRLVRQGLVAPAQRARFVQQTAPLGLKIDVSNVAEAIDLIEGHDAR